MALVRRIARPLLASVFVPSGLDQLRHPNGRSPEVTKTASKVRTLPYLGDVDAETLARASGGVQLTAGTLLAMGRLPRTSAMALAVTVLPTALTTNRFWEADDPTQRQQQQLHFLKNLSILGGLAIAAVDTEGRPGLGWRTRRTAERAKVTAKRTRRQTRKAAKRADRKRQATTARAARAAKRRTPS